MRIVDIYDFLTPSPKPAACSAIFFNENVKVNLKNQDVQIFRSQ